MPVAGKAASSPPDDSLARSGAVSAARSRHRGLAAGLDAEFVDGFVGDGRGDDLAVADIDADMRGGRALLDLDDGTLDLVACTDAHDGPHKARRAGMPQRCCLIGSMRFRDRRPRCDARLRRCDIRY
jgi:hypothetical protein